MPHNTPGCDDVACCEAVCAVNPGCCSLQWDPLCVQLAAKLCVGGGANLCAGALEIFLGTTDFSTVNATTDGVETPGDCGEFGDEQVYHEIWFDYNADFTGVLQITTCEELGGSADYDSRLAAYETCTCPADNANFLGCNDDDPNNPCGTGAGGFHSTLEIPVTAGTCYKVRVGGFTEGDMGTGTLNLQPTGPLPTGACCFSADGSCMDAVTTVECAALGGDFQGAETDCAGVECPIAPPPDSCDAPFNTEITQSVDNVTIDTGGVACAGGGITTENSWARAYDLALDIPGEAFAINCVEFAMSNSGSDLMGTVTIYRDPDGGEPGSPMDLVALGSKDFTLPGGTDLQLFQASFDPPVVAPADSTIVVTVDLPPSNDGFAVYAGNMNGESGCTYLLSESCEINTYTCAGDIGFPDLHWVQTLRGDVGAAPCPWDLNGSGDVGILDLLALLAAWGPNPGDPADFDGDGTVGILDLLALLANWGPCP
ncbi:MAG: hypothetical protein O6768_05575 [Planctomycetota bacterium]|nr:hypothetical protein [Planctomycetota bacterium]